MSARALRQIIFLTLTVFILGETISWQYNITAHIITSQQDQKHLLFFFDNVTSGPPPSFAPLGHNLTRLTLDVDTKQWNMTTFYSNLSCKPKYHQDVAYCVNAELENGTIAVHIFNMTAGRSILIPEVGITTQQFGFPRVISKVWINQQFLCIYKTDRNTVRISALKLLTGDKDYEKLFDKDISEINGIDHLVTVSRDNSKLIFLYNKHDGQTQGNYGVFRAIFTLYTQNITTSQVSSHTMSARRSSVNTDSSGHHFLSLHGISGLHTLISSKSNEQILRLEEAYRTRLKLIESSFITSQDHLIILWSFYQDSGVPQYSYEEFDHDLNLLQTRNLSAAMCRSFLQLFEIKEELYVFGYNHPYSFQEAVSKSDFILTKIPI